MKPEDHARIQREYVPSIDDSDHLEIDKQRDLRIQAMKERSNKEMQKIVHYDETLKGRVKHIKYFKNEDGTFTNDILYGFITPENDLLDDVFLHYKEIEPWREGFKELNVGDVVYFKVAKGREPGKWQAVHVKIDRDETKLAPPFRPRGQGRQHNERQKNDSDNFNR